MDDQALSVCPQQPRSHRRARQADSATEGADPVFDPPRRAADRALRRGVAERGACRVRRSAANLPGDCQPMKRSAQCARVLLAIVVGASACPDTSLAQTVKTLPSETPEKFNPTYDGFNYVKRTVKIP